MSYSAEITNSSMELNARGKIYYKDMSNHIRLDTVIADNDNEVIIDVQDFVEVHIHNEKADTTDYDVLVIVSEDKSYRTGSESFKQAFLDMFYDIRAETEEPFKIRCYSVPSKNRDKTTFLKCSIM